MRRVFLSAVAAVITLMVACTLQHEAQYKSMDAYGWALADSLTFEPSPDSVAWTRIHVRTSERYPFTQLTLELKCDTLCDTLSIDISTGARMQPTVSTATLPYPVAAPLTLRHIMSTDTLQGVHAVGVE